jgi:hypothetical protein
MKSKISEKDYEIECCEELAQFSATTCLLHNEQAIFII